MSATPYMQFYVGDYIGKTMHLTTEQHGAYLLLLMTMWTARAELPNDSAKLARIARVTPKRWPTIWSEISGFFTVDGDVIRNDRMTKERQKVLSISQERKTAGSKGGASKALKNKGTIVASAIELLPDTRASSYSEPDKEGREAKASHALLPKPKRFSEFWDAYPHRDGVKRGRKPAEAKYAAAVKSGAPEQDIIDGAKRAGLDRQVRAGFARDPTTWLNQDGWEDEIDVSKGQGNGNGNRPREAEGDRQLRLIAAAARAG